MAESKVSNENYVVVQGWMINELGLKGNELLIYAIIHGFSQTDNQVFAGSIQYLMDWTNAARRTVIYTLNELVNKNLITKVVKIINNVKSCEYKTIKRGSAEYAQVVQKLHEDGAKNAPGVVQNLHNGSAKNAPNNKDNNLINNLEDNKKKERKTTYDAILDEIENDQLRDSFKEFIKMRKLIKAPLTDQALRLSINKLYKLSKKDNERLEIVNQSIEKGWKSFYPLQKESNSNLRNPVREEIVPDWLKENQREWAEKHQREEEKEKEKSLLQRAYDFYKKKGNEAGMREKSLAYQALTGKTIEEELAEIEAFKREFGIA